jgi:GNAT superfamily N-acetyltransferase
VSLLRPARPTDAGKLGAILSEFVEDTAWMPTLHTQAEDVAHAGVMIDRGWITVAEDAGDVVGFAALDGDEVDALFVRSAARGQRVGSALLQDMQRRRKSLSLWTFQANQSAQLFYASHGFVEIARTDGARNDEKLPDVQLVWRTTKQQGEHR